MYKLQSIQRCGKGGAIMYLVGTCASGNFEDLCFNMYVQKVSSFIQMSGVKEQWKQNENWKF